MNKEGKLKVKVFSYNPPQHLEKIVNEFLANNHVEIAQINFQVAPGGTSGVYMYCALITYYQE